MQSIERALDDQGRMHGEPLTAENISNLNYAYKSISPTTHTETAIVVWAGSQSQCAKSVIDEYCRRRSGQSSQLYDHPLFALKGWCQPETHRVLIFREQLRAFTKELTGTDMAYKVYQGDEINGCSWSMFINNFTSNHAKNLTTDDAIEFYLYIQYMYAISREYSWCSTLVERALL